MVPQSVAFAVVAMGVGALSLFVLAGRRIYVSYVTGKQLIGHLLATGSFMYGANVFTSFYSLDVVGVYATIFKILFQFGVFIVILAAAHVWLTDISRFIYSIFDTTVPIRG